MGCEIKAPGIKPIIILKQLGSRLQSTTNKKNLKA